MIQPLKRLVLLTLLAAAGTGLAQGLDTSPPPAPYVSASELLPLPEFIPGVGALFIDPDDAPVGPWLAYGANGELIEILFMVPVSSMQDAQNWDDLARAVLSEAGAGPIDHVDITYNGGHPGMAEPHYHIRLVLVDPAAQQDALTQ